MQGEGAVNKGTKDPVGGERVQLAAETTLSPVLQVPGVHIADFLYRYWGVCKALVALCSL